MTAAQSPTKSARQSKNMCTLSEMRPRLPVVKPYEVWTSMKTKLRLYHQEGSMIGVRKRRGRDAPHKVKNPP